MVAPSRISFPVSGSPARRELVRDAAIGLLAVLFWVLVRIALKAPIILRPWNLPQEGMSPGGILYIPEDVFSYTSWAEQGRQGHLLSRLLFTLEPHDAILFNPFFLAIGALSRLCDISTLGALELGGLVLGGFLVFFARRVVRTITSIPYAADAATFALVLGTGFSGWVKALAWGADPGMDARPLDLFGVSALLAFPFQTGVVAFLALGLWIIDRVLRGSSGLVWRAGLAACIAFVTASHVYEGLMLAAAIGTVLALDVLRRRRPSRDELIVSALVFAGVLPFVALALWTTRHPVWSHLATVTTTWSSTRREWAIGFGWLVPSAIMGACVIGLPRARELARQEPRNPTFVGRVTIAWCAVQTSAVLLPGGVRNKFFSGGFLMFGILAGIGLAGLWAVSTRLASPASRAGIRAALVLWCALLLPTSLGIIGYTFRQHPARVDNELFQAGRLLARDGDRRQRQLVVLCDEEDGAVIPGLAGVRVVSGNWVMTPHSRTHVEELTRLGLTPRAGALGGQELRGAVDRVGADAVLVRRDASAFRWWTEESGYERVAEWRDRVLLLGR